MDLLDGILAWAIGLVVFACQFLAAGVIAIGILRSLRIFVVDILTPGRSATAIQESRIELGHSLSLALGFLIGASVLKTVAAPTWSDIGQLAAIIAIRTILNYFLVREIRAWAGDRERGGANLLGDLFDRKGTTTKEDES